MQACPDPAAAASADGLAKMAPREETLPAAAAVDVKHELAAEGQAWTAEPQGGLAALGVKEEGA